MIFHIESAMKHSYSNDDTCFNIDVIDEILEEDFDAFLDEESVKVFMDDFSIFRSSFDHCLNNLDKMLQCCKDAHLVLNWEKCHFMVKEGIVLGHKVSEAGLEVNKVKIDVISKLPPPTNIKDIANYLASDIIPKEMTYQQKKKKSQASNTASREATMLYLSVEDSFLQ
nr:retrovirus-related Pol polyprotein from transposon opus [Tanacetum cinerariifolium]